MEAPAFWRHPFRPLLGARQLAEYYVLDSEPLQARGIWFCCGVQAWVLDRARASWQSGLRLDGEPLQART